MRACCGSRVGASAGGRRSPAAADATRPQIAGTGPGTADRRRLHRRVGQRGQRRRRRPRHGDVDHDRTPRRPALLRGQPRRRRRDHRRLAGRLQRRRLRPLGRRRARQPPRRADGRRLLAAAATLDRSPANEHVFYDLGTAKAVAATDRRPAGARSTPPTPTTTAPTPQPFGRKADAIAADRERRSAQAHPGASVVATEPVAHYLLVNAGITDKTPGRLRQRGRGGRRPVARRRGRDARPDQRPPGVGAAVQPADRDRGDQADRRTPHDRPSLPVVDVTETLPEGTDYLTWQRETADELASQLDKAPQTNR